MKLVVVALYFDEELPVLGRNNLNDASLVKVWVKFWCPFVHLVIGKRSMPLGKNAFDTVMDLFGGD
jgi:hypothetical protein